MTSARTIPGNPGDVDSIRDLPVPAQDEKRPEWPALWHLLAAGGFLLAHVVLGDSYFTATTRFCAGIQAAITLLCATRYIAKRPPRLPWVELLLGVQYLEFSLPVFTGPAYMEPIHGSPPRDAYEAAACLALACTVVILTSFSFALSMWSRYRWDLFLPRVNPDILITASRIYVPVTAAFLIGVRLVPDLGRVLAPAGNLFAQIVSPLELTVVAGIVCLLRPNLQSMVQILMAVAVLVTMVTLTSMLNDAVLPLVALVIVWWYLSRSLPWIPAGVALSMFLVLQPIKGYYRTLRWQHPNLGAVDAWGQAFEEASSDSHASFATPNKSSNATIGRLDSLATLSYVIDVVPRAIPHTGGQVYPLMAASVVPRLFWPDKPDMTKYALDPFVIALGLATTASTEHTTIGLTLASEGYLEHGIPGSLAWTGLLGFITGWLSRYFGHSLIGIVVGGCIMVSLGLATEGGFFSCFGGLWQTILGATLCAWFLYFLGRPGEQPSVRSR